MFQHLLLAISLTLAGDEPSARYARPELLVEAKELATRLEDKGTRVVDARTRAKYQLGHIPGAVWVDVDQWSKAFAKSQEDAEWAKRIGALGIDDKTRVVVYDDTFSKDAARIWWILRYWGVKEAALLNGGFPAWTAEKLPTTTNVPAVAATNFKVARPRTAMLASRDTMLEILKQKKTQIVDARSEKEYCGDVKFAKKAGAMPGAIHLEWSEALDGKTQRFNSPAELAKLLKDAGIDLAKPIATHCQSGGRSSVMAFTLELMGAGAVANYYRGWAEWGNRDDTPIIIPPRKSEK